MLNKKQERHDKVECREREIFDNCFYCKSLRIEDAYVQGSPGGVVMIHFCHEHV